MEYAHFITAVLVQDHPSCTNGAPYWKVDGSFNGPLDEMQAKANRWADCAKDDAGNGPKSLVLRVSAVESNSIYKARSMTLREAELLAEMQVAA